MKDLTLDISHLAKKYHIVETNEFQLALEPIDQLNFLTEVNELSNNEPFQYKGQTCYNSGEALDMVVAEWLQIIDEVEYDLPVAGEQNVY